MKTILKKILLISTLTFSISAHVQSDVSFVPGASVGLLKLEFDRTFSDDTTKANFTMLDLSLAAVYDSFYINLNVSRPFSEAETTDVQGPVIVDTDSITLTIGCHCIEAVKGLGLYVGYLSTNTDINGEVPNFSFSEKYEDTGFFVGGSYPVLKVDAGSLTALVAYASLNGDVSVVDEFSSIDTTFSGDTTGLSYGLNWTGRISLSMDYLIKLKVQDYSFETSSFTTDKKFTSIAAGVSYYF